MLTPTATSAAPERIQFSLTLVDGNEILPQSAYCNALTRAPELLRASSTNGKGSAIPSATIR